MITFGGTTFGMPAFLDSFILYITSHTDINYFNLFLNLKNLFKNVMGWDRLQWEALPPTKKNYQIPVKP